MKRKSYLNVVPLDVDLAINIQHRQNGVTVLRTIPLITLTPLLLWFWLMWSTGLPLFNDAGVAVGSAWSSLTIAVKLVFIGVSATAYGLGV